jgi:uncharacterized protein (TIGR02996 family)
LGPTLTDDEALLRAVLADPADEAPRLVYADWLDERGDARGAYLRLDLELARSTVRDARYRAGVWRARAFRLRLDHSWVVAVSTGPGGLVKYLDLFRRDETDEWAEGGETFLPTWEAVEAGFRGLNRGDQYFARIRFGSSYKKHDWVYAVGGPDFIELVGRLHREHRRFRNTAGRAGAWHSVGISTTEEPYLCPGMEAVIRAVKWAYYYREFGPGLWTCHESAPPADVRLDIINAELTRLRAVMVRAGINPDMVHGGRQ